ncbi:MAG: hypothetical protein IT306_13730 [Chloroflexi bacterium]|nr:hypothetical protein [Chloroflexota bacterium]
MTRSLRWRLALGLLLAATLFGSGRPAGPAQAAPLGASEPVFGVATGSTESDGEMLPTGNGRFTIDDRVFVGKSIGRSVAGTAAACFTGDLRAVDEWSLEAPKMVGTHESSVTIRSERGSLTLRLRGQMEGMSASGAWQIVRGSGDCAALDGDGKYTATFSSPGKSGPDLRLTFDGETHA